MDLCSATENPNLLSYVGGFLRSFREQMRGFHDLLRQTPSSLFILLGWSSVTGSLRHMTAAVGSPWGHAGLLSGHVRTSGFILLHGEPLGTEVHAFISPLLPI
jgi:hypothetical protein